jgi:Fe-Mn family superoxide dismutase
MKQETSRRQFLAQTTKATIFTGIGASAVASILPGCGGAKNMAANNTKLYTPGFTQSTLPYGWDALEPAIDKETMNIHFTKHAAAYAKSLGEAVAAEGVNTTETSLLALLSNISKYSTKMRNNAGGHYNHELFWLWMKPGGSKAPTGKLMEDINKTFGSFETFKTQFADAGKNRFGSGWAWLYFSTDNKLAIGSTPNQDNPLMNVSEIKGAPLLGLDVWEHAYYLKYQNKRPDYITAWWNVVNWDVVGERYAAVVG